MSSRVSEDSSKYTLPNGMMTSGSELKSLQHKLLQNYYNQSPFHSSRSIINTNQFSDKNLKEREKYLRQIDNKTRFNNQQFKNSLSSDLLAQIQQKNSKKKFERLQNLEEQNKLIRYVQKFDALQRQRLNHFNTKYKMEALQDLQIKQKKRSSEFNNEKSQKQFYNNRYSIPKSESVGNIEKKLYINPTLQYCNEIEQARKTRQNLNLNNPQVFKRNSSFKVTNNQEKIQKIDNMYSSSLNEHYTKHQGYLQTLKQKQIRQKQDLRESLLSQMRQRQELNRQQKRKNHEIPYTTKDFKFVHHPINNPVDFKYAHDNRYVLGELKSIA